MTQLTQLYNCETKPSTKACIMNFFTEVGELKSCVCLKGKVEKEKVFVGINIPSFNVVMGI